MKVWVNGVPRDLEPAVSVADALATLGLPERGVAVAVDGQVVPRGEWAGLALAEGARIEVLTAVQGG